MHEITDLMRHDHHCCDARFVAVEQAVSDRSWERAENEFVAFRAAMLYHFAAEESVLFPNFERRTARAGGPTQVMREEHAQMRQLLLAAETALLEREADDYAGNAETLLIMMQQHNVKEENILYPMCDRALAGELNELLPELRKELAGGLQ